MTAHAFLLFVFFRVAFTLHSHAEFWRANLSDFVLFLPVLSDEANFSVLQFDKDETVLFALTIQNVLGLKGA